MYYAHISDDNREQPVSEHLKSTAEYSELFAAAFHAAPQGRLIGLAHDIGKCSKEFQRRLHGGPVVDHSTAGAVECSKLNMDWASFCVAGHHSGLPDGGNQMDLPGEPTLWGRLKKSVLPSGIPKYEVPLPLSKLELPQMKGQYSGLDASFMIRMLYSCLVDADYLDTERFMTNGDVKRSPPTSIETLLDKLAEHISPWWNPKSDLNRRRCEILHNCIERGKESTRGLYTLTVPTGGGKTVASLAFALHHAVRNGMDRIIYVIPYTSIIEQNAAVFREILGKDAVIEHHSAASLDSVEDIEGQKSAQALAAENWDAPVIVTTAVQFFESLYANRPSKCRKLHNIANSVIIFDEAQMMPISHLRPCVAAIAQMAAHFRSTAVLCTATQPVLGDLFHEFAPELPIQEICHDSDAFYEQFRRVTFRNAGKLSQGSLVNELSALTQVLCVVNTRKEAQEIYNQLPSEGSYHLSTLMTPAHRREILAEIKKRLENGLPCRVVSTSLIEAGVDIDFPRVFRELAGLDSILQAAGRCNREGKRPVEESVVTIFESEHHAPPLFQVNIGASKEVLRDGVDPADPETVRRYFNAWRSLVGDALDKAGVIRAFQQGISGCALPFRTVAERFHLIDNATKTIYVPWGNGEELCQRLMDGERSRKLFREAGLYSVSVYDRQFQDLWSAGDIVSLDEENAVLVNPSLYSDATGLSQETDWGKANFC